MTMVPAQNLISRKNHHHHHQGHSENHNNIVDQHREGKSGSGTYGAKDKESNNRRSEEEEEEEEQYYWCLGADMSRAAEAGPGNEYYCSGESDIVAGPMADQDESRTNSLNNNEAAASSNSKDEAANDQASWLQLSIGVHTQDPEVHHLQTKNLHDQPSAAAARPGGDGGGGASMVELDLLPPGGGGGGGGGSSRQGTLTRSAASFEAENMGGSAGLNHVVGRGIFGSSSLYSSGNNASLMYFQQYPGSTATGSANTYFLQQHQEALNWAAFRPLMIPQNIPNISNSSSSSSSSSTSSSLLMQLPQNTGNPYLAARQFQLQPPMMLAAAAGPSFDFRVVNPPRRPHSGIWFTLQASQNQAKEPFLPQISKSFLRIKDGRMTVRLLIKYLVNKLRLDSESEIEITCRGQRLLPLMTLEHIRDNIWGPTLTHSQLQHSSMSTTDHLMVLHYSRSA